MNQRFNNPGVNRKRPGRLRGAFSMIEMLVVITILLVILSVLIPSYGAIKKKARAVSCMNNLRQIGTATMLYASERGHLPHSSHLRLWCDWGELLIPYMDLLGQNQRWVPGDSWACGLYKLNDGSGQHLAGEAGQGTKNPTTGQVYAPGYSWFTCPEGPASRQPSTYKGQPGVHVYSHNYACNEYLMPYGRWANSPVAYADENAAAAAWAAGTYVPFPPVKLSELERPGSLILVCDSGVDAIDREASDTLYGPMYNYYQPGSPANETGVIPGGIVDDFVSNPALEQTRGETVVMTSPANDNDEGTGVGWPVYYRHQGRCNTLMADGHVESFANGQMKRKNFVHKGRTKDWTIGTVGFIEAFYP